RGTVQASEDGAAAAGSRDLRQDGEVLEQVGPAVAGGIIERDAVAAEVDARPEVGEDGIPEDGVAGGPGPGDDDTVAVVGDDVAHHRVVGGEVDAHAGAVAGEEVPFRGGGAAHSVAPGPGGDGHPVRAVAQGPGAEHVGADVVAPHHVARRPAAGDAD